jgi:phosphate transport system protein
VARHFQRELDDLKAKLLHIGALVEEALDHALSALHRLDPVTARDVVEGDRRIDQFEVEVEEECLKLIALYQPVAGDLRFLTALLKINNDLERVGDHAKNIAERVVKLAEHARIEGAPSLNRIGTQARKMVRESLDALVRGDVELAKQVCAEDDIVDDLNREIFGYLTRRMQEEPSLVVPAVMLLGAAKDLERVADLATNVAEDVVYMVEGDNIRHNRDRARAARPATPPAS